MSRNAKKRSCVKKGPIGHIGHISPIGRIGHIGRIGPTVSPIKAILTKPDAEVLEPKQTTQPESKFSFLKELGGSIEKKFTDRTFFDLGKNNERLGVISFINEAESKKKLFKMFSNILSNKPNISSFYQLKHSFAHSQMSDEAFIAKILDETIRQKTQTIAKVVEQNDQMTMTSYMQLWTEYTTFMRNLYLLINNYQKFLTDKSITIGKMSHNTLTVMCLVSYYESVIKKSGLKLFSHIVTNILENSSNIDQTNVEQLLSFIDSIRVFLTVQNFTNVDKDELVAIVSKCLSDAHIINQVCLHMHNLLMRVSNRNVSDSSIASSTSPTFGTVDLEQQMKKLIAKIYKLASILAIYADSNILLICYSKFMQARIINLKYQNLEIEIELVKRTSGKFGKIESQKLINGIVDMIQSKAIGQSLHSKVIKNVSGKYADIDISCRSVNPVLLGYHNWTQTSMNLPEMNLIYPLEIAYCLAVVTATFKATEGNQTDPKQIILWAPTLGSAEIEVEFKCGKVILICNFLQAILLTYLNSNPITSPMAFATDTQMHIDLAEKLFDSMLSANILIPNGSDREGFIPNTIRYQGDSRVDLAKIFIKGFDPTEEYDADVELKSKFVPKAFEIDEHASDEDFNSGENDIEVGGSTSESDSEEFVMPIVKGPKRK